MPLYFAQVPTGCRMGWPGQLSKVPDGWLLCDGSAISRTTYAALFDVLSTLHGIGDGSTTFNLPDYRDKYARGWTAATDPGGTGGNLTHTHAAHSYTPAGTVAAPVISWPAGVPTAANEGSHTHTAGTLADLGSLGSVKLFTANTATGVSASTLSGTTSAGSAHTHTISWPAGVPTNTAPAFTGTLASLTHDTVNHEPPYVKEAQIIKT